MAGFLDPTDGVYVNVNGATGEIIQDPNTGESKIVIGSNQPVGGGAGGATMSTATGQPTTGFALYSLFQAIPSWVILVGVVILALVFGGAIFRRR